MKKLIEEILALRAEIKTASLKLKIDAQASELALLSEQMTQPDFWADPSAAEAISKKSSELKNIVEPWQKLLSELNDLVELTQISEGDTEQRQLSKDFERVKKQAEELLKLVTFAGEFDTHPAIVTISAGVGGTDAQDWAGMLQIMYIKYANSNGLSVEELETSYGEEAGIKSTTLRLSGPYAYGKLKAEKGVHRLVRLSPYNSDNLRQTSFALVDVVPEIAEADSTIAESDLKIDTYRSSGNGGQSVNTTDSAVRITHLPTGIVVAIQNERSQLKNKQRAMSILQAKLSALMRESKLSDISQLRGNVRSADWGAQIRSYVLHPYTKVKDHRTGHETSDTAGVLGGDIEPFIQAYLDNEIGK